MDLLLSVFSQPLKYVNREGEKLESSMITKNVRLLSRTIFLIHHLDLCLDSLAFGKIGSSGGNGDQPLSNLGSDSIFQEAMVLYA